MNEIIKYLIEEKQESPVVARVLEKSLVKYDDIKEGFLKWLSGREYTDQPVVGGYSAKDIHELQPTMDAAGVYQFLVTLRDNPEKAKEYLNNNFARK